MYDSGDAAHTVSPESSAVGRTLLHTHTEATMRRTLAALSAAALGLLVTTGSALAQQSTTRGFTLGIHASGASISIQDRDRDNAGGGGVRIGYGVNRRFTLFAQADGAEFDDAQFDAPPGTGNIEGPWTMAHIDLGARFHFANSLRRWVPYVQAALGYRAVSVSDPIVDGTARNEVTLSGAGVTLGGGIDFYFSRTLALDVQLLWTGGEFTTLKIDNVSVSGFDIDADSSRFNVGIAWWP